MDVRMATAADTEDLVRYLLMAGEGLFEHMFDGAYPGLTANDALALGVGDADSPYHYENAYLAELNGQVVGCMVAFPSEQLGLPEIAYSVLPPERLEGVRQLFERAPPSSFYINTLATDESARGKGVGALLLDFAAELAEAAGYDSLTLHVWGDNEVARTLYASRGFEVVEALHIPPSPALRHEAPMLLLRRPVV